MQWRMAEILQAAQQCQHIYLVQLLSDVFSLLYLFSTIFGELKIYIPQPHLRSNWSENTCVACLVYGSLSLKSQCINM